MGKHDEATREVVKIYREFTGTRGSGVGPGVPVWNVVDARRINQGFWSHSGIFLSPSRVALEEIIGPLQLWKKRIENTKMTKFEAAGIKE